ncbi:MAG: restriction endonuclease subunit S, partial [Spirochaetota bacterium]
DLIFSWSASLFLSIWKHGEAALNQHLFKVVAKDDIDKYFLKSLIEFQIPEITKSSHGSTMQHITRKELYTFSVIVPTSKTEQTKIAEVLSTVDKAIEDTEKLIAKQQRLKTGLMQDLLTCGIDAKGNIRSEATHEFKDSPLGRIPIEWEVVHIGSILKTSPKNGYSPNESNSWEGVYVLGLGCLTHDGFRPTQLKFAPKLEGFMEKALLSTGDFLISRSNTQNLVGLVGIYEDIGIPCLYPDLMVRLSFSEEVINEFMELSFSSHYLRKQIQRDATGTSGSMKKINSTKIKNFLFIQPPKTEQVKILSKINKFNLLMENHNAELNKLKSLKAALMRDLLSGERSVVPLLEKTKG